MCLYCLLLCIYISIYLNRNPNAFVAVLFCSFLSFSLMIFCFYFNRPDPTRSSGITRLPNSKPLVNEYSLGDITLSNIYRCFYLLVSYIAKRLFSYQQLLYKIRPTIQCSFNSTKLCYIPKIESYQIA